jgi:uncharacterized membrane protein
MNGRRRHEITRLEGFSDAVFGFALTLLVVSLEVPRSYEELMGIMSGFASFACCFALLLWIWYEHNMFFRRYGLQDGVVVMLNGALLFVVLFYVYPLKFMFDSMFSRFVRAVNNPPVPMALHELANASAIYAIGLIVMFVMFMLLYGRAYAKRDELGLTELETFDLKSLGGHHLVSAAVGVVALAIALFAPLQAAPLSPTALCLMAPGHVAWGAFRGRQRKPLEAALAVG